MFQLYLRLIVILASLFYLILLVRFEHRECHDVEVDLTYLFKIIRIYCAEIYGWDS
jgi:hypothetical protein